MMKNLFSQNIYDILFFVDFLGHVIYGFNMGLIMVMWYVFLSRKKNEISKQPLLSARYDQLHVMNKENPI